MRGAMETQTSTHTAVIPALPVPGARRPAPFLPMSRAEMAALGWEACDIVLVTGDAYVDHPSFGLAIIGRLLEAQGFPGGIIAQPHWQSAEPFRALGKPTLVFGVTGGHLDRSAERPGGAGCDSTVRTRW